MSSFLQGDPDPARAANLKDAAEKFEALMIAQMLKSARQSDSGGWSGETDQTTSSIMDMAEQQLAELKRKGARVAILFGDEFRLGF